MTTAAKFGALDLLTPNGFNYQQLAAPQASTNTVVNVNITNRNASDTRVRLALTSVPLTPQLVTSTTANIPFLIGSTTSSGNLLYTQPINIQSTSSSGNIFTTAAIPVTASEKGTNLITCRETTAMYVGMPIVFSGSFGGLSSGVVYYILTIPTATTFTVSITWGGPVAYLTSARVAVNVQLATSAFSLKQPVVFNYNATSTTATAVTTTGNYVTVGSTANLYPGSSVVFSGTTFSNIVSGTTYYVASVSTQLPIQLANVSRSVTTVTVNTGYGIVLSSVSAKQFSSTTNTWLVTFIVPTQSTAVQTGITYVVAGNSNTAYNGSFVAVSSTVSSVTLAYTSTDPLTFGSGTTTATSLQNHGLISGQSVSITGTTALGIIDQTAVVTVVSVTQFTYTSSGTGTVTQVQSPSAVSTPIPQITISASNGGGVFTIGASATGSQTVAGNSISTVYGGPTANVTYFINTIPSTTTFTVSAVSGSGTALTLTSVTGLMTVAPSTANLAINQPIYLQGPTINIVSVSGTTFTTLGNTGMLAVNQPITFYGYTYGGVTAGTTYYIQSIPTAFTFTLAATSGGTVLSFSTVTYNMTATVAAGNLLSPLKTYYISTIPSLNTFTVSAVAGSGTPVTLSDKAAISATVASNLVTLGAGSTANLLPNQPVVFNGTTAGNLQTSPNTTALGPSPFIVTNTTNGSPGTMTVASTAGLVLGQPIQFFGNAFNILFGTAITANTVYYVFAITATTFSVATSYTNAIAGTGLALGTSSGTMFCYPSYYVGAITSSTDFTLIPLPGTTVQNTISTLATTTALNSFVQTQLTVTGQPLNTDFIEYDAIIAPDGVLERTGVLMPPNTYLYTSANTTLVNVTAIGIQEAV